MDSSFYASNLVAVRMVYFVSQDKEREPQIEESDRLDIVFPLRVVPADENLREVLRCVSINPEGQHYNVKHRKFENNFVDELKKLDLDKNMNYKAECIFRNMNLMSEYYTVAYIGDTNRARGSKAQKKNKSFFDENDDFQIEAYEKPSKKMGIRFDVGFGILILFIGIFVWD